MRKIAVDGLGDLDEAAEAILEELRGRKVVAFYGQMGAGKTTLISEICAVLGVIDVVSSPTFALVNEYHTEEGESVFHFDFYRINRIEEAFDLGYEEYFFSNSLVLIEWPEKVEQLLPEDTCRVRIEVTGETKREIYID